MACKQLTKLIFPLLLMGSSNLAQAHQVGCLLVGNPEFGAPLEHEQRLFHDFEFLFTDTEIKAGVAKFNLLSPWLQQLIRRARLEAVTIPLPTEGEETANIVSYMDYLTIDSYWYSGDPAMRLYRVDIGVGGGNGAYEYFMEAPPLFASNHSEAPAFTRVYEDFDGDLYYCHPLFQKHD